MTESNDASLDANTPPPRQISFVDIPSDILRSVAINDERLPSLYYHPNPAMRRYFWSRLRRLFRLMQKHQTGARTVLDVGGGGGVFLPTLAINYASVTLIDLVVAEARAIADMFDLRNVEFCELDILRYDLDGRRFDTIVAADVLEHFEDLDVPVARLRQWLRFGGMLFTSLPTENLVYKTLRLCFGIEKPHDHYHTASEVETYLTVNGFRRVDTECVPFGIGVLPLFRISAWRRDERPSNPQ